MLQIQDIEEQPIEKTAMPKPRTGAGWIILRVIAKSLSQILIMAVILYIAYFFTMRLVQSKPEVPKRPIFPAVYTVETVIAKAANHQPMISLFGEVVAARSVELRSLVAGEIISVNPKLKSGGSVEKGETLLEINAFDYEGALREAKSNALELKARIDEANARVALEDSRLSSGKEQLQLAKDDLDRIKQLGARGSATQKQVDDRMLVLSQRALAVEQSELNLVAEKAKIEQLKAILDRLNWKVEQSERNLRNTKLTAPFAGTIRTSQAEIGKLTSVNDIVVAMYEADKLEARFILTNERYGRLQSDVEGLVKRPIEAIWNVGGIPHKYSGMIDRIGAEIASANGGVEIFASIEPNSKDKSVLLRPGAFIEINLPDREFQNHLKLPDSAIYNDELVYVVVNGELTERKVTIGSYDGDSVLIEDGLSEGDEVLITRISEISPGLKVRKEGDPDKRPAQSGSEKPDKKAGQKPNPESDQEPSQGKAGTKPSAS